MSARIPYPGIKHGDKVRLTGASWPKAIVYKEFIVDDETYHRPVILEPIGDGAFAEWYIIEKKKNSDFSVTKVAE